MTPTEVDVVVIGGGQAGLAAGYHLARRGRKHVILDAAERTGDSWRNRWDSLRLFTPAGYSHLPGMPFPAGRHEFATKDQVADYLVEYAARNELPIEHGTRVTGLERVGADFLVVADGRQWCAGNVIIATGGHVIPRIPEYAAQLDPSIAQLSSVDYRNPSQVRPGPVLVVGAGNSGAEIAIDLATQSSTGSQVWLSGRDVGYVPRIGLGTAAFPLIRLTGHWGARLVRRALAGRADPLGRVRPGDIEKAGIIRLPRVVGVSDGMPLLADGSTADAATVVWCTGLRPEYSWIRLPVLDDVGGIRHVRGVTDEPGLYVLGLPFQSRITSHLIGGVGFDAEDIVSRLTARSAAGSAHRSLTR